jgi:putative molybdopterin biosynthesis protein
VKQGQFLDVVDEATARRRFETATSHLAPRTETVALAEALGRVLAEDVRAAVDVPGFDRSNVDGFAVRAADTFGAEELAPRRLVVAGDGLAAGAAPAADLVVAAGTAVPIATGGVLPRGADAVLMVEHTVPDGDGVRVVHAVAPGANVAFAGSDVGRGEIVMRRGSPLTSRETGLLAAVGAGEVVAFAKPRVAILSTGDEIRPPGAALAVGQVFDSNQRILADAVREAGCEAVERGIVADDERALAAAITASLADADVLLLSGGTSKGAGDLNYRVLGALVAETAGARQASPPQAAGGDGARAGSPLVGARLVSPLAVPASAILVHGVALKPGKPLCLAVLAGKPVAILPGFPTSAIFTFHDFVAPLLRRLSGRRDDPETTVAAFAPLRIPSAVGRTEYTLVDLVPSPRGVAAYPIGAGSGSVSAFSRADGFVRVPHDVEFVPEGAPVEVRLLGRGVRPADLVAVGSHCVGLDFLLGRVADAGWLVKSIVVGSQGGLAALARGEGDVAGIHLLDPESGAYNAPFLPKDVRLVSGYGRRQGLVFRRGDARFEGRDGARFVEAARAAGVRMVNRNVGSGTRVLLDRLLDGVKPDGWTNQAKSHYAVAAAVAQGRADWGMTLDVLASANGLGFVFVQDERFDLAVPAARWDRPAVAELRRLLADEAARAELRRLGLVA